jgi:PPK2 family polyphosphate:nucleotide phosphotransferase
VIAHVMAGVNPQGCDVTSFKAPSQLELDHDFLWRASVALPRRGHIGIFNRSYYEEVLVVRVHKELLKPQSLPPKLITKNIWKERFEDINAFERHLARNGIMPLKFFLHVSKEVQAKRLLARLDDPAKQWKFNAGDVGERALWDKFMDAYDEMIRATATDDAPWYVVPADHKWFTRLVVAAAIVERLEAIDPKFPKLDEAELRDLAALRAALSGK